MKVFVDTNIIIDAYEETRPTHEAAALLLALGELGEFELWASPTQWSDVFYILTNGARKSCIEQGMRILKNARRQLHVSMMGEAEIDRALSSGWDDFEDALVHQAALCAQADVLVTNNKPDFARSAIPVFTCDELFSWLEQERGVSYAQIALNASSYI